MKPHSLALVLSILTLAGCTSAPPPQTQAPSPTPPVATSSYPNLTVQAKQLETALANKDYAKVIDLTYPKIVEVGGGREKLLAGMTNEMKTMEAEGVVLLSSTASAPTQFVSNANEIYAVIPVTTRIKATDGIFQTEGSLIGISIDGGQSWTFVDATGKDQTELKKVLPNLDRLNIPPEKAPVKLATN
jgi:hypothetical protein